MGRESGEEEVGEESQRGMRRTKRELRMGEVR